MKCSALAYHSGKDGGPFKVRYNMAEENYKSILQGKICGGI